MKKTLTINLGGTVFNIDEDAYQLLDNYLSNLRLHFKKEEGSDEIMDDFELRISELFTERIRLGHNVITIEHVENIIQRMGKPEELFDETDTNLEAENKKEKEEEGNKDLGKKKKLMRDPDNRIFGGVAGGIAAYMGWDATVIRIILILLLFFPINIPIGVIYIILWIAMPLANTAADKLIMRGENVTVENIGKTVTDGFDNTTNNIENNESTEKARTKIQKAADIFVSIIGFILKGLIIVGMVICIPILIISLPFILLAFIALFTGVSTITNIIPLGDLFVGVPTMPIFTSGIFTLLIIGIPLCVLIYNLCVSLFKFKPIASPVKWVLLTLWIIAIIGALWSFTQFGFRPHPFWWNHTIHTFHSI